MARSKKRHEFQPDRTGSGVLSKLYVTRKQRLGLLKWLLYALVLLVLSVVQDTMLCRLRIYGATTDLVPCGILLICVLQSAEASCTFALAAAVVYLFSGTSPGPYCIVFLTFLGLSASVFRQGYLRKGFSATMLCTGTALLVYELALFVAGLALNQTHPGRIVGFGITWLLTLLAMPLLYPIAVAINKIGGESWKE